MYGGMVMEDGNAKEVLSKTYHPYTKALLDSLPKFGDHYQNIELKTIAGNVPNPLKPEKGCPFEPRCDYKKPECSLKVPEMNNEGHNYRCIINGVKN